MILLPRNKSIGEINGSSKIDSDADGESRGKNPTLSPLSAKDSVNSVVYRVVSLGKIKILLKRQFRKSLRHC
jgi:hypothetical protein